MVEKIAIVTGSDKGIGKEIVIGLAKKNYKIIMACIDISNAHKSKNEIIENIKNQNINVMYIDLASFKAIDDFCDEIKSKFNYIDVLMNNAAIIVNNYSETEDGFETHFQVNYLSVFYLTKQLLPLLSKSKDGRIINVTTSNYKYGKNYFSTAIKVYNPSDNRQILKNNYQSVLKKNYNVFTSYPKSKYELILFTCELSQYVKNMGYKNLSVTCVDTGVAKTKLGEQVHNTWKGTFTKAYVNFFGQSIEKAAENPLICCFTNEINKFNGKLFLGNNKFKDLYQKEENKIFGMVLWELSTKLVNSN